MYQQIFAKYNSFFWTIDNENLGQNLEFLARTRLYFVNLAQGALAATVAKWNFNWSLWRV